MQLIGTIDHDQFPIGIFLVGIFRNIGCPQEAPHLIFVTIFFQNHEEGQVCILFYVVDKVRRFPVNVELFQDHVDTSHQVGTITPGYQWNPGIGVFCYV